MKISLFVIGKTSKKYLQAGIDDYVKRIGHYVKFEMKVIPDVKTGNKEAVSVLKKKEAEQVFKHISDADTLVLLDENGKIFDSVEFAGYIEKKSIASTKHLVFLVGGAFGFADELYTRANDKIALSKMTFSHQAIRFICAEQLYRAFTIIRNEPYHNA